MIRRTRTSDSWNDRERLLSQQVAQFAATWDWERVFGHWKSRLEDFGIDPSNLFREVTVCDPADPSGRAPSLSWWRAQDVRERQEKLQQHLLQWPGTTGPIHPETYYQRKGELDTIQYLYESKDDATALAAVLIAASLFARLRARRRTYPSDLWPPFQCAEVLEKLAYAHWNATRRVLGWADTCTVVIPYISPDYHYPITTLDALVRYVAEEHAALLCQYQLIEIRFVESCDPFIERRFRERKQEEAERQRAWEKTRREEEDREEKERAEWLRVHPRFEDWESLPHEELQRLVWSMPTTSIAKEFGVSDSAIGKRCRVAGIKKPPPGFWNRVEAGKISHPQGIPVEEK